MTTQEYGQAAPRNAKIIRVGAGYRVIWDLGDGLGWAWYSASPSLLKEIWGPDYADQIVETLPNASAFTAKYGNYYWGSIAEINLTAQTPWEDMMSRIYNSFGPIPGMQTSAELKRLAIQGYFESWSVSEWLSHYHQTAYWQRLNTTQQEWTQASAAEQTRLVQSMAGQLLEIYRRYWGTDPPNGLNNKNLQGMATRIASGLADISVYETRMRTQASAVEGTPAWRDVLAETQATGEAEVTRENWQVAVGNLWRQWVGPGSPPDSFTTRWAEDLFMNTQSEADLIETLKNMGMSLWPNKPRDITWEEWATPTIGNVEAMLEIDSLDPSDLLLQDLLQKGLTGTDALRTIRHDSRFKQTNRFRTELSDAVANLGVQFGFLPSLG